MPDLIGDVLFAGLIGLCGGVLILVTRPRIWASLDRKSLGFDPVRGWLRRKAPSLDRAIIGVARVIGRFAGVLFVLWSMAYLAASLLSRF